MDLVDCHCTNARRAALALTAAYDRALSRLGLKITQFSLLRAVQRHPEANVTELSLATGLDRSTLGRNLRLLQAAGWLDLGHGNDRRGRVVALTPAGQRLLHRALPIWGRVQTEVADTLGGDATRFQRVARAVVQHFGPGTDIEACS